MFYQLEEVVSAIKEKKWGVKQLMQVIRMYCMTCQNCPRRERPDLFQLILKDDTFADIAWFTPRDQHAFGGHLCKYCLIYLINFWNCFSVLNLCPFFFYVFFSYLSCVVMWVKWRDSAVILKTKKKWEGIPLVLIVFYFMYMLETYKQLLINKCLHQWINYYCLLWWTVREEIMRRMICYYIADILQGIKVPAGKEVKILIF